MYIVWGTKHRAEERGIVADWCNLCGGIRAHKLTAHYMVGHIYYIPLGRGTLKATTRACTECTAETEADVAYYGRTMKPRDAAGVAMDTLMEVTNGHLAREMRERQEMIAEMQQRLALSRVQSDVPGGGVGVTDTRLLTAIQQLEDFDIRRGDIAHFFSRLRRWDLLPTEDRNTLFDEVYSFATGERAVNRAVRLLRILPKPEPKWVGWVAFLGWIAATITGFSLLPFLWSWIWGTLFVLVGVVTALLLYGRKVNAYVRNWVGSVLVPRAHDDHVDLNVFVGVLAGLKESKASKDGVPENIQNIVSNMDVIAESLFERGLLNLEEKAETTEAKEAAETVGTER